MQGVQRPPRRGRLLQEALLLVPNLLEHSTALGESSGDRAWETCGCPVPAFTINECSACPSAAVYAPSYFNSIYGLALHVYIFADSWHFIWTEQNLNIKSSIHITAAAMLLCAQHRN